MPTLSKLSFPVLQPQQQLLLQLQQLQQQRRLKTTSVVAPDATTQVANFWHSIRLDHSINYVKLTSPNDNTVKQQLQQNQEMCFHHQHNKNSTTESTSSPSPPLPCSSPRPQSLFSSMQQTVSVTTTADTDSPSNLLNTQLMSSATTTKHKRPYSKASNRHLSTTQAPQPYDPDNITKQLINHRHVGDVYELGEEIGAGAFGWVIKATHKETGIVRAMKAQSIIENKWCFRELEMASRVDHPNCANAIDAFIHKDKLLIVSPLYTGSDLYDYIVDDNRAAFTEHHAFELCFQMLSALEACHRAGFAHLDVKPENFMFKHSGPGSPLVLVDYGSAEPFEKAAYAETADDYVPYDDDVLTTLSRITGTACYMSPEVARGNFSSRSDVWSAAICLYILMALEPPFEMTLKPRSTTNNTAGLPSEEPRFQQTPNLAHPAISTMTENGQQLMVNMMHYDPAQRLSATEALIKIREHMNALEDAGMV
jgi:hypothetical protein